MQTLKQGSLLQGGKYRIVKVLGQGGFGITYLALQSGLERKVAIKEFFMKDLCNRDEATSQVSVGSTGSVDMVERFKAKFLKEASNIARLNHPNIVRIYDIFEENGTAYYVMEYAGNGSLADRVKQQGHLPESVAKRYIHQVADALDYIHQQKMNHLDVKPANIMLSESDDAILIDFGMSKQYDAVTGNQTSTTPIGISHGYAPMEQYNACGVSSFSPQTDIYSLGATLYKLVTGKTPPQASELINEGLPRLAHNLSTGVRNVIIKSMQVRKNDRPENIKDFLTIIESDIITAENDTTAINSLRFEDDVTKVLGNQDSTTNGMQTNGKKPTPPINRNENETKKSKYIFFVYFIFYFGVGNYYVQNQSTHVALNHFK